VYPKGRLLGLPVLSETVPVYTSLTRLVRDVTIGQKAEIAPLLTPDGTWL